MTELRINPRSDVDDLAHAFRARAGSGCSTCCERESAEALHDYLDEQDDWWRLINAPDGILEYDRRSWERLGVRRRNALDAEVFARAQERLPISIRRAPRTR